MEMVGIMAGILGLVLLCYLLLRAIHNSTVDAMNDFYGDDKTFGLIFVLAILGVCLYEGIKISDKDK